MGLVFPAVAPAATVVNGDFETGTLAGWTVVNQESGNGSWFAYSGTAAPIEEEFEPEPREVPAPPQGNFAAITDETGPGVHVLYQDITLAAGMSHTLSLIPYYRSQAPIFVPSPDTLSTETENQQYRIDVMRTTAPIDSVNPADILATVFRTNPGDPQDLAAKAVTADLSPFAGQTVRLRLAEVDTESFFNAGVDAVSVASVSPPPPPPSNLFSLAKLTLNKKKGNATLRVSVSGPGSVSVVAKRIKKTTVSAAAAGIVTVKLKPTGAGKKVLKKKGKLKFKGLVTFTPNGGTASSQTLSGKLKLTPKPKPKQRPRQQ